MKANPIRGKLAVFFALVLLLVNPASAEQDEEGPITPG